MSDRSTGSCQQPVEEGALQQVPPGCPANRDSQGHCWASTPLPPVLPLPTPAANNKGAKSTQNQGSTQSIPAAGSDNSILPALVAPQAQGSRDTAPQQRHCYSPPAPQMSAFLLLAASVSPQLCCHQSGGRDRSASSCVERVFCLQDKEQKAQILHRAEQLRCCQLSLYPFPHPTAHATGSLTNVLQHQNSTELLTPFPQKSLDLPTNPSP